MSVLKKDRKPTFYSPLYTHQTSLHALRQHLPQIELFFSVEKTQSAMKFRNGTGKEQNCFFAMCNTEILPSVRDCDFFQQCENIGLKGG